MKTTKGLNIKDKSGYFFTDMTNINSFDPSLLIINEITVFGSGSTMYEINDDKEPNTPHIVFNDITCVFRKSGENKYLIFCETRENKRMLQNYTEIFDEMKEQVVSTTDNDTFIMGKDFMRIKFNTDDNLPYNEKNQCFNLCNSKKYHF